MTSEPVTASKTKKANEISVAWLLIALAGFVCYAVFNKQVFPSASIEYALSKEEATLAAKKVATDFFHYDLKKTIQTTTFNTDEDAKTVLEFKLGINKANQLMRADVPVYFWRTRFCKELSKDELWVAWTASGKLKSVYRNIDNDAKIPNLNKQQALALATECATKLGRQDLSKFVLFQYGTEPKTNRIDHHFEWAKEAGYPESNLRIRIGVAGNRVYQYRYYLQPSDTWSREYKKIREDNELLGKIASFFIFVFMAGALAAFVHGLNTNNIRWRFTLTCCAIVVVLFVLDQANSWSNTVDSSYETSLTYANFIARTCLQTLLGVVGILLLTITLLGGAETIYRRSWPKHMALPNLLSMRGMANPDFFVKSVYGYLIVGGMMLWVIGFYLIGEKFNFFCPLAVDDYRSIGTWCPAVSAALIGVSAAGLEELACRVVALGLLTRYLRNFWLANIIQAVVWGFAHSQYPQMPSYARGVELTVVGFVFGCITNVMGVFPCFVAHYLYDAFLTAEPVFATHQLKLTLPAIAVLLPFMLGPMYAKRWAKKRNLVDDVDLSNAAEKLPPPVKKHVEEIVDRSATVYHALSKNARIVLVVVILIGAGSAFFPSIHNVGDDRQVTINAGRARELARKQLVESGIKQEDWMTTLDMLSKPDSDESLKWQYLFEQVGKARLAKIYNETQPCLEWRARFFKPLEPKSYWVFLDGHGGVRAHTVENVDEGIGAKLTEQQALAVIDTYITKHRPDLSPYKVIGKIKTEHPKRTDYRFDLLIPKYYAGVTPGKLTAEVKGDEISELLIDWDVPDSWMWPRKTMKWYQQVDAVFRIVAIIGLLVTMLGWGIHVLRATTIRWKGPLFVAGVGAALFALATANSAVKLFSNYNTAESLTSFLAQSFAVESVKVLLWSVAMLVATLAAFATVRLSFPSIANQLRHNLLLVPHNNYERTLRSNVWVDAALSSYACVGVVMLIKYLQDFLTDRCSPALHLDSPHFITSMFSTSFPSVDLTTSILSGAVIGLVVLALLAGVWKRFVRTELLAALFVLAAAALIAGQEWYRQEIAINFLQAVLLATTALIFIKRVFRTNIVAYVFVALEMAAGLRLSELLLHGPQIAQVEIGIIVIFLAFPLVATIILCALDKNKSAGSVESGEASAQNLTEAQDDSLPADAAGNVNAAAGNVNAAASNDDSVVHNDESLSEEEANSPIKLEIDREAFPSEPENPSDPHA